MKHRDLWNQFVSPDNTYRMAPLMRVNDAVDREEAFR